MNKSTPFIKTLTSKWPNIESLATPFDKVRHVLRLFKILTHYWRLLRYFEISLHADFEQP